MGSGQSSDKLHFNRYLDGKGPPPLFQQASDDLNGRNRGRRDIQPEGQMTWVILPRDLPGFPGDNTLQINYMFPDGIQTEKHPHPGQPYGGLQRSAYLPDNRDGRKVLQLLDKAFMEQLLFTVTTNQDGQDTVTAASIPLKSQPDGAQALGVAADAPYGGFVVDMMDPVLRSDGYPDSDYLQTVTKLLRDKGIE